MKGWWNSNDTADARCALQGCYQDDGGFVGLEGDTYCSPAHRDLDDTCKRRKRAERVAECNCSCHDQALERINALEAQVLEQSFALAVTANDAETIRRQGDEIARLKGPCNMGTPREDHRIEPCSIDCDWQ